MIVCAHFKATPDQLRRLVANLIEASGLERPSPNKIRIDLDKAISVNISMWYGKRVNIYVFVTDGVYRITHHKSWYTEGRIWGTLYETAEEIVNSVSGIEIVKLENELQWESRLLEQMSFRK